MRKLMWCLILALVVGCDGASFDFLFDIGELSATTVVGDGNTTTMGSGSSGPQANTQASSWAGYEVVVAVEYNSAIPVSLYVTDPNGSPWTGVVRNGQLSVAWREGTAVAGCYRYLLSAGVDYDNSPGAVDATVRVFLNGELLTEDTYTLVELSNLQDWFYYRLDRAEGA